MAKLSQKAKPIQQGEPAGPIIHKKSLGRRIAENWQYYILILPAILYVAIWCYAPMYGLQIAFKNYKFALGITGSKWVGFRHFQDFFKGYYISTLLENTFAISLYSLCVGFPIPIIVALILNELTPKFKKVVQTVMYAPHFISTVVLIGTMQLLFSPSTGIVNHALAAMGFDRLYFMGEPQYFRHMFVWSGVWQGMGWSAIIYLAALSNVDPTHLEAASIDGASRIQKIIHINIPTILPTIIIMLILRMGQIASVGYEKVYLMQNNLNMDVAEVISTYVYKRGIVNSNYSFSTAVGLFNNVVNVTLVVLANFISKKVTKQGLF